MSDPTLFDAIPARNTDPVTSRDAGTDILAAEGVLRPGTQCARLLAAYASSGESLADFEVAAMAGLYRAHVCYWHRCGDLLRAGLLDETGETRVNPDTNKARRVLVINAAGWAEARRLAKADTGI